MADPPAGSFSHRRPRTVTQAMRLQADHACCSHYIHCALYQTLYLSFCCKIASARAGHQASVGVYTVLLSVTWSPALHMQLALSQHVLTHVAYVLPWHALGLQSHCTCGSILSSVISIEARWSRLHDAWPGQHILHRASCLSALHLQTMSVPCIVVHRLCRWTSTLRRSQSARST